MLPLTQAEWGLSSREAGMVQAGFHLGYLTSLFIVGFIADHFGAKRAYITTGVAACLSPWAFVLFADGFWSAFWLHAFTGLCQGGTYTPALALINDHVERARRGRAMGYLIAGSSAGYAICLLTAGAALNFTGWRGALAVVAFLPVVSWITGVLVLRGTPNTIHARPAGESLLASVPAVWRNRRGMLSIWGYTFHNWELLGLWAWLPAFLTAALVLHGHQNPAALALSFAALTYVANIAGSIAGGTMADRWGRTQTILTWSCVSLALSFSIGWMIALPLAAAGGTRLPVQLRRHRRLVDPLAGPRRERAAALLGSGLCDPLGDRLRRGRDQPGRLRLGTRRVRSFLGVGLGDARPGRRPRAARDLEAEAAAVKPFSEASERNRAPILEVLKRIFAHSRTVLEIGAGTGQHAAYFAAELPHLVWQASDVAEHLPGIRQWVSDPAPIELDVDKPWPAVEADAVFSANTCHIMSWPQVQRMFKGIGKIPSLKTFCLYGPFNYSGSHTSESNARFDAMLRARDPASGIRDFEAINALAETAGLVLQEDNAMPANNRLLVWRPRP